MNHPSRHILIVGAALADEFSKYAAGTAETSVVARRRSVRNLVGTYRCRVEIDPDERDDAWLRAAINVDRSHSVTGIAAFGESNQVQAAMIADALRLPFHSVETMSDIHDKSRMRRRLHEYGLCDVPYARVDDARELADRIADVGYPCIVKPVVGSGSAGVSLVRRPEEVRSAFDRAFEEKGRRANAAWLGIAVERYLEGTHVSVEALSDRGRHHVVAVTATAYDHQTFVQLGHAVPATLHPYRTSEIRSYVRSVLDALGVRHGPTHTELMLTARGPRVIETHARLGGDYIPELVRRATSVDMQDLAFDLALGESVAGSLGKSDSAGLAAHAVWFRSVAADCTVQRAHNLGPANTRQLVADGAFVRAAAGVDSRVVCAFASARSAADALRRARRKSEEIVIDTVPTLISAP